MASPVLSVRMGSPPPADRQGNRDFSRGVKQLVDTSRDLRSVPSDYILPVNICPSPVPYASIPVIDLYGLDGPAAPRMLTVQAISSACACWGFFRIVNHGIKHSLMEEMIRSVEGFFSLPCEEKIKYASDDVMDPVRYGTGLTTTTPHARFWRDYLRHYGHPIQNTYHLWPDNPSNYRQVAKEYLEEVRRLALTLAGAISEGLGLEKGHIEESLRKGCQIVGANYYPPCPEPHRTLGLCGHSDHGGLTILLQNDVEGFQVKKDGKWVAVTHVQGTFLVNIGDYMEILSNGRYKSVEHRAVVNEHKTRISIAVGHGPDLESTLAPASQFVNKNRGPKYRPIVYKDYIRSQQSSVVRGKTALQGIMIGTCQLDLKETSSSWE